MNLLSNSALVILSSPIGKEIYTPTDNKIAGVTKDVISLVGGLGGLFFTLAVLIIACVIIFGSISSRNIGKVWIALFSCVGGALLFYSAYFLSDAIAGIVS